MCFSPEMKACTCQMMRTGELFTLETKQQQPKMTVDEVSEHFQEVEPLVKMFQTRQDKRDKIQFGMVGSDEKYLYLIVGPFDNQELNIFRSRAGTSHFDLMRDHDWFHMLMVE
jgi:hypothetical protein